MPANPRTPQEAATLLQQAIAHMNRAAWGEASALLEAVLAARLLEPDALQLLGAVRAAQGRDGEAETLYRRSLALSPHQPHVHMNLGNLLSRRDHALARAAYGEAIRLKPDYAEAHLNLASTEAALDDFAAAERSYRTVLRLQPGSAAARIGLGGVLNHLKRADEAERLLSEAAPQVSAPRQQAALLHNLGVTRKMQRRYDEALTLYDRARALQPDLATIDYNRGNVLQNLGRLDEAVESYRAALAKNPLDVLAHKDLNTLLYRLARDGEFLTSFDEAQSRVAPNTKLALAKAEFLLTAQRMEEARDTLLRAFAIAPEQPSILSGLAAAHLALGDSGKALAAHEHLLRLLPQNGAAHAGFATTLLKLRDPRKALALAECAVALAPRDQNALATFGLALRALDDTREEQLNDYDAFVQVFDLDPPDGFADMTAFNAALNSYLDRLHVDRREYLEQTLRSGTQTFDALFESGHALVDALRVRIDRAVATYIARMKDAPQHPLHGRRARDFAYSGSWSSRLRDCGFHTNHVHPEGWISSCYYIAVPDAAEDAREKQGWIKFGEPDFDAGFAEPIRRSVQPKPGRLVLFPSYMWHGTVPFRGATARTTIAFDVIPR